MSRSIIGQLKSIMWSGAVLLALAVAAPAAAQVTIQFGGPQVPGFSNYYPWFNDVPQYRGDHTFRWFLYTHPNIARELARSPGLLYNVNWRRQRPQLLRYLASHPYVWQALQTQYYSTGPAETQWGDYDNQRQWRDAYWWHQFHPDWFYNTHQNWVSLNPRWRNYDGAYDQQHVWHYGEWWYQQDPSWVSSRHPDWLRQNPHWTNQATQQRNQQNQQQDQQRQAALEQQQRNLQQRRATELQNQQQDQQRQAAREQQLRNRQQPATQPQGQPNRRQDTLRQQNQTPQHATTRQKPQQQSRSQQQQDKHRGNKRQ